MRLTAVVIAMAMACAMPVLAQPPVETNGGDPTSGAAAKLETQQREGALAMQALRDGDFKAARKHAERVTQEGATDVSAWLMLGRAQSGLNDWKAASRTYAYAVRMKPTSPEAHAGYGVALARRGNADGAAKQLAWLSQVAQACGASCGQIAKLKADVEAAIAAGATAG